MRKETRERIEAYKSYLPGMKERVFGAVLMLLIAVTLVVSATFAWITLSSSPEVSNIDTTVAANGNLEIALAHDNGRILPTSGRGDSSAVDNDLQRANITWGNIINLSDPDYGLASITLRPASLTGTTGLLNNPLYGVTYGADGRVINNTSEDDFAYSYFQPDFETFSVDLAGNHYGVRAISTITYTNLQGNNILADLVNQYSQKLNTAKAGYAKMTDQSSEPGASYILSLQGLIQQYAQAQIDGGLSNMNVTQYVPDLHEMMNYLNENAMTPLAEAYLYLGRICYLKEVGNIDEFDNLYTVDSFCAQAAAGTLPAYMSDIRGLSSFATDRQYLLGQLDASRTNTLAYWAQQANNGTTVNWGRIDGVLSWVVDTDTCTLDGYQMSKLKNMTIALQVVGNSSHSAVINGGALYRTELRIGQYMSPKLTITVDATSISPVAGKPTFRDVPVTTSAKTGTLVEIRDDKDRSMIGAGNYKGTDAVAEDTYAMAIDFWVRTNAGPAKGSVSETTTSTTEEGEVVRVVSPEQAFLTLEGVILTEEIDEPRTVNVSGNENVNNGSYPIYTAKFTYNGEEQTVEVYKAKDKRGDEHYWLQRELVFEGGAADAHTNVETLANAMGFSASSITYTAVIEKKNVVIGYDGVNRVWTDEQMVPYEVAGATSTTMGGGSCYVFYASNEADQTRFLQLLNAMKVVFVDQEGRMIGRADMATDSYYAENGKVTVPLVLDSTQAVNLGTNVDGKNIYGLIPLEKNVPTRVTAIVYLDGTSLTNDMVLASGDIQGSLNLQFGSVTAREVTTTTTTTEGDETTITTDTTYTQPGTLTPATNPDLMEDHVSVSATASPTEFEYNANRPSTTTVSVNVDGTTPNAVAVRFTRAINSTQGVLQQMVNLERTRGTSWTGAYSFSKPGNYIMRSVFVDGVEYDLPEELSISVVGSSVTSLSCDAIPSGSFASILTADNRFNTSIVMGFSTSHAQPRAVRGIFLDENGRQVTVIFSPRGSGNWIGTASFTSSGTFTMKYVEIDGEQYELAANLQPTLELILGLHVRTWVSASQATLEKLQAIDANATPTRFTLDTAAKDDQNQPILNVTGTPGDDVTINISAALYDNSNNPVTGFTNATIVYGKSGSATEKLDADLTWNSGTGRYEGEFLVTKAGTYKFTRMSVGNNNIASFSTAPGIQALPPEDAYYFNNYTPAYQFAPSGDANAVIGLAYSNAALRVTGTFTDLRGNRIVTEGILGGEAEDQGDKTVNLWYLPIPVVDGGQDGTWTLAEVALYGVYYEGAYYDEETPAVIDLASQNIVTKVVNAVYTTFSGTSQNFTGALLEDHKTSFVFELKDYEGQAIRNATVDSVNLKYFLNSAAVNLDSYGYSADSLAGIVVTANGVLRSGTDATYDFTDLNFLYAGPYVNCELTYRINGVSYTVEPGANNTYYDGGRISETFPKFDVKWTAPTVKVTGTNPAPTTSFTNAGNSYQVHNYYSDYYANVYAERSGSLLGNATYDISQITLNLSNAGTKLSSTNKATFTILNATPDDLSDSDKPGNVFTFTANNQSKSGDVGAHPSGSFLGGGWRRVSNQTIDFIMVSYGGHNLKVKLSHGVEIKNDDKAYPKLTYAGLDTCPAIDNPEPEVSVDGKNFAITLPVLSGVEHLSESLGDTTVKYKYTAEVQRYSWTSTSGCSTTTNYARTADITVEKIEVGELRDFDRTYTVTKWTIDSSAKNPGTSYTVSSVTTATATYTYTDGNYGAPYNGESTTASASKSVTGNDALTAAATLGSGAVKSGNATTYTWYEDASGNVLSGNKPTNYTYLCNNLPTTN